MPGRGHIDVVEYWYIMLQEGIDLEAAWLILNKSREGLFIDHYQEMCVQLLTASIWQRWIETILGMTLYACMYVDSVIQLLKVFQMSVTCGKILHTEHTILFNPYKNPLKSLSVILFNV